MAGEIGEVRTNRRLTAEVMLFERGLPQMLPKFFLGFCGVTAQDTRARHAVVG
jgi:hypothetical protein